MPRRKKRYKKTNRAATLIAIAAFLSLLIFFILRWQEAQKIKFVKYEAFGIDIPANYAIHGIDVSRYQKFIGWNQVREMNVMNIRIGFAFIKATEGELLIDPYFRRNWKAAAEAAVQRGAYHFFQPAKNPLVQANHFIKQVKLKSGDLPPVLDIEVTANVPTPILRANALIWLRTVEQHYKIKPIIYTNAAFYLHFLGKDFDAYPLWVAHYYERHQPRIQRNWLFWQHNDRGRVNGIDAPVDFNVFNGDSALFRQLLIK